VTITFDYNLLQFLRTTKTKKRKKKSKKHEIIKKQKQNMKSKNPVNFQGIIDRKLQKKQKQNQAM